MRISISSRCSHIIILISTMILVSCGAAPELKSQIDIINIDPEELKDEVSVDSVYTAISYIPLETLDESLIATVDKLIATESLYIIFDKSQQAVFIFNKENGKYLSKIAKLGKGPLKSIFQKQFQIQSK